MRGIFSTLRKITAIIFSRVVTKKPSKIVKFTKIRQTLRITYLTWPKRSNIKLVVPSNLIKQENVCLIPRESEHPSNKENWIFIHLCKPASIKQRAVNPRLGEFCERTLPENLWYWNGYRWGGVNFIQQTKTSIGSVAIFLKTIKITFVGSLMSKN